MKTVVFHPFAEQELLDAAAYYEEQNPGLGLDFLAEVQGSVNLLIRYPNMGSEVQGLIRRLVLPKFPYSLLYRVVDGSLIRLLAVAHHKRNPQYWVDRE